MTDEPLYTVEEASERLRVAQETVRQWIRKGALRALRVGPAGLIRIPKSAFDELLTQDKCKNSRPV